MKAFFSLRAGSTQLVYPWTDFRIWARIWQTPPPCFSLQGIVLHAVLITARLKSSRLKLKLMREIRGKTVFQHVVDRCKQVSNAEQVVLCTSNDPQDIPLLEQAEELGIEKFIGDPDDVVKRLTDAADVHGVDSFIGITGDNPLFSVNHAITIGEIFRRDPGMDFVYTTGMPIGVNVYGAGIAAMRTICEVKEIIDTEIWGALINRPEIFKVRELPVEEKFYLNDYPRITLDYEEDLQLITKIFEAMEDPVPDYMDVVEFLKNNKALSRINEGIVQLDLPAEVKESIENYYRENREKVLAIRQKMHKL